MARVFIEGFELGCVTPYIWDNFAGSAYINTSPSTYGMSGTYCMRLTTDSYYEHIFRAADYTSDLYFSIRMYTNDNLSSILRIYNNNLNELIEIAYNADYGYSQVYAEITSVTTYRGTVSMHKNQPYRIEVRYKPHVSNGILQVKVNGVLDIDKTGVQTCHSSYTPNVDRFRLYGYDVSYVDDVVVDDADWVGNTRIQGITPSGDVTCEWTAVPATNRYANINEIPWRSDSSDAEYIYTDDINKISLFECANLVDSTAQPIISVKSVQISARAKLVGDATNVPKLGLGVQPAGSGTIYYGSSHSVEQDNWRSFNTIWSTNPAGGNWDMTTVNNMNIAIKSLAS